MTLAIFLSISPAVREGLTSSHRQGAQGQGKEIQAYKGFLTSVSTITR